MKKFLHPNSLSEIIKHSNKEPILIFKHSLTCPISANAYNGIEEGNKKDLIPYPIYLVIVQKERNLSNEIAQTFGITHESPQIILIKNGKALYNTSHRNIQVKNIPKT